MLGNRLKIYPRTPYFEFGGRYIFLWGGGGGGGRVAEN